MALSINLIRALSQRGRDRMRMTGESGPHPNPLPEGEGINLQVGGDVGGDCLELVFVVGDGVEEHVAEAGLAHAPEGVGAAVGAAPDGPVLGDGAVVVVVGADPGAQLVEGAAFVLVEGEVDALGEAEGGVAAPLLRPDAG